MTLADYDIVGSYNNQRISSIDAERTINLFEYIDPLGKKQKSLLPTSGLKNSNINFIGAGANPALGFRSSFSYKDNHYHVIGSKVFLVNSSGSVTNLTTLSEFSTFVGYVGVDANDHEIIWVDGDSAIVYNTTTNEVTFKKSTTDTNFPPNPLDVCFLDGFIIIISGNTNHFQLSAINNATIWGPTSMSFTVGPPAPPTMIMTMNTTNFPTGSPVLLSTTGSLPGVSTGPALDTVTTYFIVRKTATTAHLARTLADALIDNSLTFTSTGSGSSVTLVGQVQLGSITSHPGTLVACRTLHRRIFFFSQFFTEVWENAGAGTNLPFRRQNSLLMEYGTASVGSVSVGFDKLFFLSQDRDGLGAVMEVIGTESIPVSNRALDFQLAQYIQDPLIGVADSRAFLIKENGIIFYRLNFTKADVTYVYNVTISDPSQEQGKLWHEEQTLVGNRHLTQTHVFYNGVNYAGSYLVPTLYIVDSSFVTNDGENIKRTRIGKAFAPSTYQRIRIDRFHLDIVQGSILEVGPDSLPTVYLSYSKDGGQSYGNRLLADMGPLGNRTFRTVWRKLGTVPRGQSFVPKIEFYNKVPFIILGAAWNYEVMPE